MNAKVIGVGMTSQRTRDRLIDRLRTEGIRDERVLQALKDLPRHLFIDEALASRAYEDTALPIGHAQTISQPYIVALMSQALLAAGRPNKVLEIGTGSGYQTAVLSRLVEKVFTVERIQALHWQARTLLAELNVVNARFKLADGGLGWSEHAPYDGIIVTAAGSDIPRSLLEQLADGGRMIIPVGESHAQDLLLLERRGAEYHRTSLGKVNFVPLIHSSGNGG